MFIGSTEFSAVEILKEFGRPYDEEFNNWLNYEWKPRQDDLREEILSYQANADRYLDLRASFGRQQVVPLVGSGMSAPTGLLTWSDFLKEIGKFAQCGLSELEQLICSSNFEGAADLLAESMAPKLLIERVSHNLRINPSDTVKGPVCLLPSLFPNLVITTNLDNVLERVYELCDVPLHTHLMEDNLRIIVNYRIQKNGFCSNCMEIVRIKRSACCFPMSMKKHMP